RPQTMAELAERVHDCVYDPEVLFDEHSLQVLTDDDEIECASHVFDDHFRAGVPADFTAYLLHDDWRLPAGSGRGGFTPAIDAGPLRPAWREKGTTWFVLQTAEETSCLTEMRYPMRIDGVRVPGLCRYLAEVTPQLAHAGGEMDWPWELRLLRALVPDGPSSAAVLRATLEQANALAVRELDRLGGGRGEGMEGDLASARRELAELIARRDEAKKTTQRSQRADPSLSVIQGEEHLAQLCVNVTAPSPEYGRRY